MSFSNITQITTEHSEWLKGLDFYKEDIHILEHRLAEIVSKNTSFEARQGVEHFQNQFLIQLNNIDELSHKVREHNSFFARSPLVVEELIENERLADHENLKDEYMFFEKIMKDLRQEFNIYLSKWM